ncbi:hypothetical protein ACW9H6_29080 [Pseudomonas sp. SDO528_S397]
MITEKDITPNKMMAVLDWAYDKAVDGVTGLGSAEEMARDGLK